MISLQAIAIWPKTNVNLWTRFALPSSLLQNLRRRVKKKVCLKAKIKASTRLLSL